MRKTKRPSRGRPSWPFLYDGRWHIIGLLVTVQLLLPLYSTRSLFSSVMIQKEVHRALPAKTPLALTKRVQGAFHIVPGAFKWRANYASIGAKPAKRTIYGAPESGIFHISRLPRRLSLPQAVAGFCTVFIKQNPEIRFSHKRPVSRVLNALDVLSAAIVEGGAEAHRQKLVPADLISSRFPGDLRAEAPVHSDGIAPDSHRLPFSPAFRRTPLWFNPFILFCNCSAPAAPGC